MCNDKMRVSSEGRGLIYIGGYGRSGSTLLDVLMNASDDIVSTGELRFFPRHVLEKKIPCSCGKSFEECTLWSEVLCNLGPGNLASRLSELQRAFNMTEGWGGLVKTLKQGDGLNEYREKVGLFYQAVFKAAEKKHVSESSKNAGGARMRPLLLKKVCGLDVKLIHLVRDPRGVYWSSLRGGNEAQELGLETTRFFGGVRALMGWLLANIACFINGMILGRKNYCIIRHEDIISNPGGELRRLGNFLDLDLTPVIEKIISGEALSAGHIVGGNRMARAGTIRIKANHSWKDGMSNWKQVGIWLVMWPLMKSFHYSLFPHNNTQSSD